MIDCPPRNLQRDFSHCDFLSTKPTWQLFSNIKSHSALFMKLLSHPKTSSAKLDSSVLSRSLHTSMNMCVTCLLKLEDMFINWYLPTQTNKGHFSLELFWISITETFISTARSISGFGSSFDWTSSLDISLTDIKWFVSAPPKIAPYILEIVRSGEKNFHQIWDLWWHVFNFLTNICTELGVYWRLIYHKWWMPDPLNWCCISA